MGEIGEVSCQKSSERKKLKKFTYIIGLLPAFEVIIGYICIMFMDSSAGAAIGLGTILLTVKWLFIWFPLWFYNLYKVIRLYIHGEPIKKVFIVLLALGIIPPIAWLLLMAFICELLQKIFDNL